MLLQKCIIKNSAPALNKILMVVQYLWHFEYFATDEKEFCRLPPFGYSGQDAFGGDVDSVEFGKQFFGSSSFDLAVVLLGRILEWVGGDDGHVVTPDCQLGGQRGVEVIVALRRESEIGQNARAVRPQGVGGQQHHARQHDSAQKMHFECVESCHAWQNRFNLQSSGSKLKTAPAILSFVCFTTDFYLVCWSMCYLVESAKATYCLLLEINIYSNNNKE